MTESLAKLIGVKKDRAGEPVEPTDHIRERLAAALYFNMRYGRPSFYSPMPTTEVYRRFLFEPKDIRESWEYAADNFLRSLDQLGLVLEERGGPSA